MAKELGMWDMAPTALPKWLIEQLDLIVDTWDETEPPYTWDRESVLEKIVADALDAAICAEIEQAPPALEGGAA